MLADDLGRRLSGADGVRDGAKKRSGTTKIMKIPEGLG